MNKLVRAIDDVSVYTGRFLAWWTLLAVGIITLEVLLRYVFDHPTNWAHESMTLVFAMQYILSGAYAHVTRSHVRVDVLYQAVPARAKAVLDAITSLLFFAYVGVMTYTGWEFFHDSWAMREVSFTDWGPPLYPVKFTVFLGSLLLLVQGLANFVRDVALALGKELA